jgi:hypothetical protein
MATVPEEYTTEEQGSVVRFLCAKGLNAKDIHKSMIPVYGGKCDFHLFYVLYPTVTYLLIPPLMLLRKIIF